MVPMHQVYATRDPRNDDEDDALTEYLTKYRKEEREDRLVNTAILIFLALFLLVRCWG